MNKLSPNSRYNTPKKRRRHAQQQKRWKSKYPERCSEARRICRLKNRRLNPVAHREELRHYHKTVAGKIVKARTRAKRKGLQILFILNNFTPGYHLHHLTEHIGIYIPESLHRSIRHDIWTGTGTIKLNDAISSWMDAGGR